MNEDTIFPSDPREVQAAQVQLERELNDTLKEMEALRDEVDDLRNFKREVDGDGCVPASRVQLLEDVIRERDELKQRLEALQSKALTP